MLFRRKNLVLWVSSSPLVFPGFVRDCRVFAVFAGFTDNTSGTSAYQVGGEKVRCLQELPREFANNMYQPARVHPDLSDLLESRYIRPIVKDAALL